MSAADIISGAAASALDARKRGPISGESMKPVYTVVRLNPVNMNLTKLGVDFVSHVRNVAM